MKTSKYIKTAVNLLLCIVLVTVAQAQAISTEKPQKIYATTTEDAFAVPPSPINYIEIQNEIDYPITCRKLGVEGKVVTKILVCEKGNAKQVIFVESLHPDLKLACQEKIKDLKFKPARDQDGNPTKGWVVVPFHFRLSI